MNQENRSHSIAESQFKIAHGPFNRSMQSRKTPVCIEDRGSDAVIGQLSVARVVISEAVGAVYGTVVAWQKRNLCIPAAFGADNVMHRAVFVVPAAGTARIAIA